MFKILQAIYNRLMALKNGLVTHDTLWVGQPHTPATVDALMLSIQKKDAEIKALEVQLHDKREEARELAHQLDDVADQIERRATGFHADNLPRLADYGMPVPGTTQRQAAQVPVKGVVRQISDDDDGQGFVIRIDRIDGADHYEVERSESGGAMLFLRTVKKIKFVDDDVTSGVRYHYRVRGVNRRGAGEWSEAVGAIQ